MVFGKHFDDRSGNIVRQIRDNSNPAVTILKQRLEIDREHISLNEAKPVTVDCVRQVPDHITVDFDCGDTGAPIKQPDGQHTLSWADFKHMIVTAGMDCVDYTVGNMVIGKKMLSEAFSGYMIHIWYSLSGDAEKTAGVPGGNLLHLTDIDVLDLRQRTGHLRHI